MYISSFIHTYTARDPWKHEYVHMEQHNLSLHNSIYNIPRKYK